ncbi:hypothetical protein [Nannocystis punicea]|uniref:Uncharacterized protein n=1 Tax=Nannocystis punicea TaxID=2995304 RepID=A0ABY7HDZ6_9BACT|nr:hypothetical protein [Nannocystis poenicansa]WAS97194.1 hypothetical protein O0S08_13685 [Nannocystis poenicansa]
MGSTASEAARALLAAAAERATYRDVERVARALEYLRRRRHLDGWRPAALLERHPALEHPLDEDLVGLEQPSPTLCWRLALHGVPKPEQLTRAEARAKWARIRLSWTRTRARAQPHRMTRAEFIEWISDRKDMPDGEAVDDGRSGGAPGDDTRLVA